jgi:hypothetical protein
MSASTSRPPRVRFLTAAGAAVLGAAVLLAGAGGGGGQAIAAQTVSAPLAQAAAPATAELVAAKTPIQILKAARKKAKKAKTVRVQASIEDKDGVTHLDLRMTKTKATGTLSDPTDGSMKLILVSKKTGYFKPGEKMLDEIAGGDESVKALLAGRWLVFHKGDGLDDLFTLGKMKSYTQDVFTLSGPESGLTKVKGKKVKGYKKTVGLKEKGHKGVLLIAADGTNRLAGYQDPDTRITYSRWNKKVTVKAPANPLDLDDLS